MNQSNHSVGRPKGSRNRNVVNARRAIADFVESSIPRFNSWLDEIASGIPKRDSQGRPLSDSQGSIVYLVKPDPATAMKLVADICEYHLPKLSRSEQSVVAKVEMGPVDLASLSTEDLKLYILRQAGIDSMTIDVEPVSVPIASDWLK